VELHAIVRRGNEDGFVPEAIEAAAVEFQRRNLSSADVGILDRNLGVILAEQAAVAAQPLPLLAQLIFFVFSGGPLLALLLVGALGRVLRRSRAIESKDDMNVVSSGWSKLEVVTFVTAGFIVPLILALLAGSWRRSNAERKFADARKAAKRGAIFWAVLFGLLYVTSEQLHWW
jgi:hypothetical protein